MSTLVTPPASPPPASDSVPRVAFSTRQAWAVLVLVAGLAALRAVRHVHGFNMTHWVFSYEHGFVKRAFVGEVILRVLGPPTALAITVLSFALAFLVIAALVFLFITPALREGQRLGAWLFALVALTHSATIPHVFWDIGRFDQFGLLVLFLCLIILAKAPLLRLALVPPLCLIGLLIHEAFFFLSFPVIMAVWFYEEGRERVWVKLGVVAGMMALFWTIGRSGMHAILPMDQYVTLLQARHSFGIDGGAVWVLYGNLYDAVAYNTIRIRETGQIIHHLLLTLTLVPTFLLFRSLTQRMCEGRGRGRWRRCLLLASALTPLALYIPATDFFRWWSAAITNLFIVFVYLAIREQTVVTLVDAVERRPMVAAAIVGISLVLGPMGIEASYPLFDGLGILPGWPWWG